MYQQKLQPRKLPQQFPFQARVFNKMIKSNLNKTCIINATIGLSMGFSILSLAAINFTPSSAAANEQVVNLYSFRQPFLIKPLLDEFTKQTNINVNVVFAKKGMLEKIRAAGNNNPADAVLTTDIGRLNALSQAGVLKPIRSKILETNIPVNLRQKDGLWFALTTRARVVFASVDRVKPGEITTLADLASPKAKGRVCLRSGKHAYNIALIASVIANDGEKAAEKWLRGLKRNLARKPQGNDRAQAKAIYQGQCDIALANTYYMGKMVTEKKKTEQNDWAKSIRVQFLDQKGRGQHVNISGAAVTKTAKHEKQAIKLLEFLSGKTAQSIYAAQNFEYPVNPSVKPSKLVQSWGDFKADSIAIEEIAKYRAAASKLVDKVGFNDGPSS